MTACATGHGAENPPTVLRSASSAATCVEIKFYGVFVLNHRVVLHAIDAAPKCLVARVEILMSDDGAPKMTSFLVEDLDEVLEVSD